MSSCIAKMLDKINTVNGWDVIDNKRCFAMGNKKNCNDEILNNPFIKDEMISFTRKYNITDYNINTVNNEYGLFYILSMSIDDYINLYKKINNIHNETEKNLEL